MDGFGIGGDGGIEIAVAIECIGQVEVIGGIARLDRDGFANEIDREGVLAGLESDQAEAMEGVGVVGVLGKDLAVEGFGFGKAAGRVMLEGGLKGGFDGSGRHGAFLTVGLL